MRRTYRGGFTIIESMLVLAITGALVAVLLVGVGTSLNVQRYRDSLVSLRSLIQTQYTELQNVRNDRSANWNCDAEATPTEGGARIAGQTDCVLMGRYISIQNSDVTIASIVGYQIAPVTGDDVTTMRQSYNLGIASATIERDTMDWGTSITWPTAGPSARSDQNRSITVLLLRSPTSGITYTFASNTVHSIESVDSDDLKEPIVIGDATPGQAQQTLCVNSNGLVLGDTQAVVITAYASGPSAVELRTNEVMETLGDTTRC